MKFLKKALSNIVQLKGDWTSILLCMVWGRGILSFIKAVFLRIPILNQFADYVVPLIFFMVFVMAWRGFSKYIRGQEVFFYLICATIYISTYIIFPQNSKYLDDYLPLFLLTALPFIFLGVSIDINKLFEPFYLISLLYLIFRFATEIFIDTEPSMNEDDYGYNMVGAYELLPYFLMVTAHILRKFNYIDLIVLLLGVFLLFSFGTRGPFLCVGIFILAYFLLCIPLKKNFWKYTLIIGIVVFVVSSFTSILDFLDTYIELFNKSSRIINAINNDTITDDNGRVRIHQSILNALSYAGPLGLGICGDRVASGGHYSHDIFIEILASFGYFIGSIVIVTMVILFIRAYRMCKTQDEKTFLIVLISFAAHHFLTGSFLSSSTFFLLVGFAIRMTNKPYFSALDQKRVRVLEPNINARLI